MLGWEFPPFISGGLGTACYGLTRALDRQGHEVMFVLPRAVEGTAASHVKLITPAGSVPRVGETADAADAVVEARGEVIPAGVAPGDFERVRFIGVPSTVRSPYAASGEAVEQIGEHGASGPTKATAREVEALRAAGVDVPDDWSLAAPMTSGGADYHGDVLGTVQRYAQMALKMCRTQQFDVIHAHDWMTYPAGMVLARVTGKPLVTHIHSTEFDRSGEHVNQQIYDIERRGMHAAVRVIAVSMLTKTIVTTRYGLEPPKVEVVYNGVDFSGGPPLNGVGIDSRDKIVLFLGRITMQKGPEYFIAAAKRVLEKMGNVKFLVAGSGDMARRMIELAATMGIGHKVLFTGFLRGKDVERVFRMADLYVMPSVSEPFGIAPLEAMSHDTPVIISKQSGVSEVLSHALKVDFWDVQEMANKMIAVLRHPPLSQTLSKHGAFEIRKLTWDGAAQRCVQVYGDSADAFRQLHEPIALA
ncbi:MAG: glycosyltransferase family 4 protein [Planctomycetota bacterium]